MRLVWITDPHLNFLPAFGPRRFGELVAGEQPNGDAVVMTGDIAELDSLGECLGDFVAGWGKPLYFVLGNHDAYGGSLEGAARAARAVERASGGRARWLTESGVVALTKNTVLVGHDGWYDARCGAPETTPVELADFALIDDLRGLDRAELLSKVRALGDAAAQETEPLLRAALACARRVVFATHVPPFREACWHQGKISDDQWLPWFTCKAIGDMLIACAAAHPKTELLVLCGHTHGAGRALVRPNLEVLTGAARYGAPDVHAVLDLD